MNKKARKKDEQSILRNKIEARKYRRMTQRHKTEFAVYYILEKKNKKPYVNQED